MKLRANRTDQLARTAIPYDARMLSIPRQPNELTPEWCTSVLRNAGHEATVSAVELSPVGTGQMADSLRARLSYHERSRQSPDSLVVKMTSADESSHAAGARGAYQREVEWYRELNDTTSIATPEMLFADIDVDTAEFVLVLQDMHPARQGDQVAGCSVDQARRALANVVGLHAPTWCRGDLVTTTWLHPTDDPDARMAMADQLFAHSTTGFLDRYDTSLSAEQRELVSWFAGRFGQWLRKDHPVFAATHGDYRLDNLLFESAPGKQVWTVDWQTVRVDNPLADVSYLLGTGLDSDERAAHEAELVAEYHQGLVDHGVTDYTINDCRADYRAQSLYSLVIIVLGSMLAKQTDRGDEMFMAMLDRASRQIADLDATATLG